MDWQRRAVLPDLLICIGCGVLFRVVRLERSIGCYDRVQCPCGQTLLKGANANQYDLEAVESAVEFELN